MFNHPAPGCPQRATPGSRPQKGNTLNGDRHSPNALQGLHQPHSTRYKHSPNAKTRRKKNSACPLSGNGGAVTVPARRERILELYADGRVARGVRLPLLQLVIDGELEARPV